jgi:hypothetical protein
LPIRERILGSTNRAPGITVASAECCIPVS